MRCRRLPIHPGLPVHPGLAVHPGFRLRCRRAFSLLELLVVIGIIALLLAFTFIIALRFKSSAGDVNCLSNLMQIRSALAAYAADHGGRLPELGVGDPAWETLLQARMPGASFQCPADKEVFPVFGSSYDWRDTGDPATTLAGKLLSEARLGAVLAFDTFPGWHQKSMMNAVFVDGSARPMAEQECLGDLQRSGLR
jgi:prepilin-type N-terminal cleavage/methylation domain-containing protein/prepilin-type processing-associated H-X9-DG protein